MRNVIIVSFVWAAIWALVSGEAAVAKQGPPTASKAANSSQPPQSEDGGRDNQAISRERLEFDRQKAASDAAAASERLKVEQDRLQVEKDRLDFEKSKIWWTAVSTVAPFIGVLLTLIYSIWSFSKQSAQQADQFSKQFTQQAQQWRLDAKQRYKQWRADAEQRDRQQAADAKLQFELKAAEIAFEGETPLAVQHRAEALKAMFGERLPNHFLSSYDPDKFGQKEGNPEYKKFLLELLLKYPDNQLEIVLFWKQIFPGDVGWLIRLDNLSSGRITKKASEEGDYSRQEDGTHQSSSETDITVTPPTEEDDKTSGNRDRTTDSGPDANESAEVNKDPIT